MNILFYLRKGFQNMLKISSAQKPNLHNSILGKRKLDYTYQGFISSTPRPPLASPKLEQNSIKEDDKNKKS